MIYVFPGMGADSRMYAGSWRMLPDCTFLDWPDDAKEKSIRAIARRMADDAKIMDDSVLIGSSLGGIVACEISKIRKLKALVLVGSAKKREEISRLLQIIHPLVDLAPLEFIQLAAGKVPSDLARMFNRSHATFIRAMCRAIFEWSGLDGSIISPRRIHGQRDRVIPLPEDAHMVLQGGHLIAMTHADECVEFIRANQHLQATPR